MTRREVLALTRRRGMYTLLSEEELEPHAVENPDFDSKLEQEDERLLLTEAMLTLPVKEYKLIFALFLDDSEPSYEQISQKLNMPVASIGPTRARILAKLQRRLRRKGFKF
jgi:RNA polymerase sigma factor (sigma-70 family)